MTGAEGEQTDAFRVLLRESQAIVAGTVLCAAVIAASAGMIASIGTLCVAIVGTVALYWIAAVYAATIARLIGTRGRLLHVLAEVLRRSWHVALASLLPLGVLVAAALLGAGLATAATIALLGTIAILAGYGYLAGRAGGLSAWACVGAAAAGAGIGGLIVLLRSAVM